MEQITTKLQKRSDISSEQDNFNSGLIHDLQNPLSIIQFSLTLLEIIVKKTSLREKLTPAERERFEKLFSNIRYGSETIGGIIKNMIQPETLTLKKNNLHILLERIIETFQNTFCEGVRTFELHYTISESSFIFDLERLTRVFENLLLNAVKFTSGGMIIMEVTGNEDFVIISVKDSGVGIKEEHLSRIFDYGFSSSSDGGFHGIGLYNVKKIIEMHGGVVEAFSREGVGSIFKVYLPRNLG